VDDVRLGPYVYCASHVGPHESGWCTVSLDNKIGLLASDYDEAFELVKHLGYPIDGYCRVCYKYTANEVHSNCLDHTEDEYADAALRKDDLRRYLWERSLDKAKA
jgi:hypothetical protein